MTSRIIGTGSALPENIVTNDYLTTLVDTSDEWISDRTGIRERRIVITETTASLAADAAKAALTDANTLPGEIELLIVATFTPDHAMPSTSCEVQAALGADNAACFDLNAACTGFIFALQTAHAYISAGLIKKALIIGAETTSKAVDWRDRSTCILFGDGAGAVVVEADSDGILSLTAGSDGSKGNTLTCNAIPLNNPFVRAGGVSPYIFMDGQEVFKFAVRKIPELIIELTNNAKISPGDLQCILLHQANKRILQAAAKRLELSEDVFPMNLNLYGNTSAASVPILLDELNRDGKLERGKPFVIAGFGGGLTWGAVLINW